MFILLTILLLLNLNAFAINDISNLEKGTKEDKLFEMANDLRKDFGIKPFKFSYALYQEAIKQNKLLSTSDDRKDYYNKDYFYKRYKEQNNLLKQIFASYKKSFFYKRVITNKEYKSLAISIIKKGNTYHILHIFQKNTTLRDDAIPKTYEQKDVYLKEEKDFNKVLDFLALENIKFSFSKKETLKRLKPLFKSFKRDYNILSTVDEISISQEERHLPKNYLRFIFSPSPKSFGGLYAISFYFKEANYMRIKKWAETVYNIKAPPNNKKTLDIKESANPPFSFYRFDEKEKLYFAIQDDRIIEITWDKDKGTYLSISSLHFGLKYINNHKEEYKLKHSISKWIYYRILTEFLKRTKANFSLADFMKHVSIYFFKDKKEIEAYIYADKDKIKLRYLYNYDDGKRFVEEIYLNGIRLDKLQINTNPQ